MEISGWEGEAAENGDTNPKKNFLTINRACENVKKDSRESMNPHDPINSPLKPLSAGHAHTGIQIKPHLIKSSGVMQDSQKN